MARDRNLFLWQAYVFASSIFAAVCFIALCWFLFTQGTNLKTAEAANLRATEAEANLRKEMTSVQTLSTILGGRPANSPDEYRQLEKNISDVAEIADIQKAYSSHMNLLGDNASARNYRQLIETLVQTLRERNLQVEAQAKREEDLKAVNAETVARETAARDQERKRADDLATQLNKEKENFAIRVKEQQDELTKIAEDQRKTNELNKRKEKELRRDLDEAVKKRDELAKRNDALGRELEKLRGEEFQFAHGRITNVGDGGRTVYVNLGKQDGLREGVRFGVLDDNVTRVSDAKPKAKIEIVKIVKDHGHLAVAKVVSDGKATILPGDKIYSVAWQPGAHVKVALLGKMDRNGDGIDDREELKEMLARNDAEVTAEFLPNGTVQGKITADTRFLIIGDEFRVAGNDLSQDPNAQSMAVKRAEFENNARAMGVGRINLDKFWGWLKGSGEEDDVIPLGSASRSADNPRRNPPVSSRGKVSPLFQDQSTGKARSIDN